MADLWPWLAVAGTGALHGLNPVTGWLPAAAQGLRSGEPGHALRALVPIGVGHLASMALVAGAVAFGLSMDRSVVAAVAGSLLMVAAAIHRWRRAAPRRRAPAAGQAALGLWSFSVSTLHGAGLMLVPALMPLCAGSAAARSAGVSSSLLLAFAAVAVHGAAMLAVTGGVVAAVLPLSRRWVPGASPACRPMHAEPLRQTPSPCIPKALARGRTPAETP